MTRTNRTPKVTMMMPIYDGTKQLISGTRGGESTNNSSSVVDLFGWYATQPCLVLVHAENCTNGFDIYAFEAEDTSLQHGVKVGTVGRSDASMSVRNTIHTYLKKGDYILLQLGAGCAVSWTVSAYPLRPVQVSIA